MPWLIFLAGVAWLVLCWLCLAFVTVPLTLFAISAGLLCGAALAINGYRRIYTGTEDKRVLARPNAEAPRWRRAPYPRWDGGWPSYLSWQAERDFLAAFAWPRQQADRFWAKGMEWARPYLLPLMGALPLLPIPVGFLVGVTAGTYGGWAVLAAAVEIIMAIPRCLRLSAIWVLRGVDSSVRWWRGAAPTCPRCRYVTWLPAYRCRVLAPVRSFIETCGRDGSAYGSVAASAQTIYPRPSCALRASSPRYALIAATRCISRLAWYRMRG